MGNCASSPEEVAAKAISRQIDQTISAEQKTSGLQGTIKLLILGAGDTGKSTVLKQFRLIYGTGFTEQEKVSFRAAILLNILTSARALVEAMDKLKIPYGFDPSDTDKYGELMNHGASVTNMAKSIPSSRRQTLGASGSIMQLASVGSEAKQSFLDLKVSHMDGLVDVPKDATARLAEILYNKQKVSETSPVYWASDRVRGLELIPHAIPRDAVDAIKCVWEDPGIQYCYSRRGEVQLMDTCAFFLNDIDRFCASDFEPTDQDILNARVLTTTITETKFEIQNVLYRVFDVGGQRSERKKWAPYFDDVSAIIYLVAISSFDQRCMEDESANRMLESLNLFGTICNHPVFKKTNFILFMNKIDLFKEKLKTILVSTYFPDYTGPNEYTATSQYFSSRFQGINKYPEKSIYTHFTWATDTKQIKNVLETVRGIIQKQNLASLGLT